MITYEQARKDHEYLWSKYAPAFDMSGAYVDQDDLDRLLRNPSKKTARAIYCAQINYWFRVGPDFFEDRLSSKERQFELQKLIAKDIKLKQIASRYGII